MALWIWISRHRMLLGQLVFMWGQKYLLSWRLYRTQDNPDNEKMNKPLLTSKKIE